MSIDIQVENLTKIYSISHLGNGQESFRERIESSFCRLIGFNRRYELEKNSIEKFVALDNVSFEVKQGERLGVIGGNGAGKSTLLKILSRITEPTSGRITIRGRLASLLEVGTGFHPELSGRENIYLNGAVLGMPKSEIRAKFDEIVGFAEIGRFLDTPVKYYSSGMYVRLAFSVAIHLEPDILIIDEVLSVGDQAFQKRCADRVRALTGAGRTVIIVSHSMNMVRSLCDKALFLQNGKVMSFSSVEDAAADYSHSVLENAQGDLAWHKASFLATDDTLSIKVDNSQYAICLGGEILNQDGVVTSKLEIDKPFKITLHYRLNEAVSFRIVPNFHFYDGNGERFFISFPETTAPTTLGEHRVSCNIDPFLFNVGRFSVVCILSSYELDPPVHFAVEHALRFEVSEPESADLRRHGWLGHLPGVSRPRLVWEYYS